MSWGRIEGQWKLQRGIAVDQSRKMMNVELAAIDSKAEYRVGRLQERYKIATQEANGQVKEFENAGMSYSNPDLYFL